MRNILLFPAAMAAIAAPAAAQAQTLPAAVIAVVDLQRVTDQCAACKAAKTALQGQYTALQNREKTLAQPLQTEQKAIQTAINALNGKDPDSALQARIKAFESKRQQSADEVSSQQQQLQRNSAYVSKQISDKLGPIYQQVMQRHGANVMLEQAATLAAASQIDVTNEVLSALNTALPSVSTNAPAQQQPQGR